MAGCCIGSQFSTSLVILFGVTWYFQSSLDLLQQQVEYDRELLFKLQEQINVSTSVQMYSTYFNIILNTFSHKNHNPQREE